MKKRVLSFVLILTILASMSVFVPLSASAENVAKSYKINVVFDELLCNVEMSDYYTNSSVSNGGYIKENYDEGRGENRAYLVIEISDIPEGYRIENVAENGHDVTRGFVSGAYGGMATTITSDTVFEIEIKKIPDNLPNIVSTTGIYWDSNQQKKVSEQITFDTENCRLYTSPVFFDEITYPDYFSGCYWEYSADGENWFPLTTWGNRTDFWAAWPNHTSDWTDQKFDFMNNNYYLRAHLFGRDGYSSGEIYTEVLTVNSAKKENNAQMEEPELEQKDEQTEFELKDYVVIRTEEDLRNIAYDMSASYILANDITLTNNWKTINISDFTGVLDGNGYAIKNFNIISNNEPYVGLFAINNGSIKNLTILNANIEFKSPYMDTKCGVLSALNKTNGIIENCKVTGKIVCNESMGSIGGIVGSNSGMILQCGNEADVIIKNPNAVETECWIFAAGIAGSNRCHIRDCYNVGNIDVQGNSSFFSVICSAGICSGESFSDGVDIINCYNIGSINAEILSDDSQYNNSLFVGEISCKECPTSNGIYYLKGKNSVMHWNEIGLSKEELKNQSSFAEFDFNNIWTLNSQNGEFMYPVHKQYKPIIISDRNDRKTEVIDLTFSIEKSSQLGNEKITNSYSDSYQFGSSIYANTIKKHLIQNNDGTYTRVEYTNDKNVIIENYNQNFELINTRTIPLSLPIYGGFYAGSEYNFIVCGQTNLNENDTLPTFRVTKYSKNWEELGSADYCNNNTTIPFDAGSLRMAEYEGVLYIRTCHEMYTSEDGLNHQANVTFSVSINDMKIKNEVSDVLNNGYGYVSHSFNQFIDVIDGKLVAADHGDAYPRGMVLFRYNKSLDESGIFTDGNWGAVDYSNVISFDGEIGENATYASLSDLTHSDSNYIMAGTHAEFGKSTRNVYIATINKENMSVIYKKLTNYAENGKLIVSAPHLVKISDNCFLAIWKCGEYSGSEFGNIAIAVLDGDGNLKSNISTDSGCLGQCHPILSDNKVVWYCMVDSKPVFYSIDVSELINVSQNDFKNAVYIFKKAIPPTIYCEYNSYDRTKATEAEISLYAGDYKSKIYYTTDGTEPTTSSTLYTGEFKIDRNTQIKAIAVADNLEISEVTSKSVTLGYKTDTSEIDKEKDKSGICMMFSDVQETDWYYEAVKFAFEKGITSGVSETLYAPNDKVTRGQFITMLCRAYGIKEMTGDNFADCGDTWYTGYLAAAKQLKISNGIGDNKFAPTKEITREEMVTLIYNYLKSAGNVDAETNEILFADNYDISDWAKLGVAFASGKGYINGKGNNLFDPKGDATRAELAQIFFNIFK